jgi:hypothetical protein
MSEPTPLELEMQQNSYEAGYISGWIDQEERIIKLLESERWKLPNGMPAGGEVYLPLEQAIALIKGENK